MNRLPSRQTLADLSVENRWSTLDALARDLRDQIEVAANARHRGEVRRKLDRVYGAADHFGDYVGQPDRAEAA